MESISLIDACLPASSDTGHHDNFYEDHNSDEAYSEVDALEDEVKEDEMQQQASFTDENSGTAFASADNNSSTLPPACDFEIEITSDNVGKIIGSKGAVIKELEVRSGAKLHIKTSSRLGVCPGNLSKLRIRGAPEQVKCASELVRKILLEGYASIHVNAMTGEPQIYVTIDCLGKYNFGSGGEILRFIQSESGARIRFVKDHPRDSSRKVVVSGTQTAVSCATQLIQLFFEKGPLAIGMIGESSLALSTENSLINGLSPSPPPPHRVVVGDGNKTSSISCPKSLLGFIIGKDGQSIKQLARNTETKITCSKTSETEDPCTVWISGPSRNVAMAGQVLADLIRKATQRCLRGGDKTKEHILRFQHKLDKKLRANEIVETEEFFESSTLAHMKKRSPKVRAVEHRQACAPPITFVTLTKKDIKSLALPEDATEKAIRKRDFRYQDMALKAASEPCPDGLCGDDILRLLKDQPLDSVQQSLGCKMLHLPELDQWVVIGDEHSIAAAIVLARRMMK